MEKITILCDKLRCELRNEYENLKMNFYKNFPITKKDEEFIDDEFDDCNEEGYNFDENFDETYDDLDDYNNEEYDDENSDYEFFEKQVDFENNVFSKLGNYIKESKYKSLFLLIILEDVYEYLKSQEIIDFVLQDYEIEILEKLELHDLDDLLKKLTNSETFFLDMITLFFEYDCEASIEDRFKNRKLIELSNNYEYLKKFKINILDDMHYEYVKRRF